jgi:hypothetical protein
MSLDACFIRGLYMGNEGYPDKLGAASMGVPVQFFD